MCGNNRMLNKLIMLTINIVNSDNEQLFCKLYPHEAVFCLSCYNK